jgi:hypothetical protein
MRLGTLILPATVRARLAAGGQVGDVRHGPADGCNAARRPRSFNAIGTHADVVPASA